METLRGARRVANARLIDVTEVVPGARQELAGAGRGDREFDRRVIPAVDADVGPERNLPAIAVGVPVEVKDVIVSALVWLAVGMNDFVPTYPPRFERQMAENREPPVDFNGAKRRQDFNNIFR